MTPLDDDKTLAARFAWCAFVAHLQNLNALKHPVVKPLREYLTKLCGDGPDTIFWEQCGSDASELFYTLETGKPALRIVDGGEPNGET